MPGPLTERTCTSPQTSSSAAAHRFEQSTVSVWGDPSCWPS